MFASSIFASSIFDPFFKLFASVLAFFYAITNNYALAIILLTLAVMIIVTPLTLKGTRSMMMMQQLQPEMKKIQARYKDDRQKLNEELLKFYKENNINPLGGCLPLLVQMPVFLVLYQVLRGLTRRVSDLGGATGWMSGQFPGGNPVKPPSLVRTFDPAWINPSTKMYQNLSVSTHDGRLRHGPVRERQQGHAAGHRPRHALPGAHRHRGRHRLHAAAPDPGPQPQRPGQPATADDHEDHADLPAGDLLRAAGRPGPLLRGVQHSTASPSRRSSPTASTAARPTG